MFRLKIFENELQIRDWNGNVMLSTQVQLKKGNNRLPVDVSKLRTGLYSVIITLPSGETMSSKLLKL
jgi:hypothetical protein